MSWALEDGETLDQPFIDLPAITVSVDAGKVPAPLVITGVHERAWFRTIVGRGTVFGNRLRLAGLAVFSDLTLRDVSDATLEVTADRGPTPLTLLANDSATDLGYVDQSYFTSDVHACAGATPNAHRRAVRGAAEK